MNVQLQCLNDQEENLTTVQIPIEHWKKLERMKKYERPFRGKEDLTETFKELRQVRDGKIPKQAWSEFLHEI